MAAIWGIIDLSKIKKTCTEYDHQSEEVYILDIQHRYNKLEKCYKDLNLDQYGRYEQQNVLMGYGITKVNRYSAVNEETAEHFNDQFIMVSDVWLDNRSEVIEEIIRVSQKKKMSIYNKLEEKSDNELLEILYYLKGEEMVLNLRGLFTVAVWNSRKQELILVSDQVSSRCLYYTVLNDQIVFSTLMDPILEMNKKVGFSINDNYNKDFLLMDGAYAYMVPGETPYNEINLMTPASIVKINKNGISKCKYDIFEETGSDTISEKKNVSDDFMDIYQSAVEDALATDEKIGIALSSGLDSASIAALASIQLLKQNKKLYSYTFLPLADLNQETNSVITDEGSQVKELIGKYSNIQGKFLNNNGRNLFQDIKACNDILEIPYKTGTFSNHKEMCSIASKEGCKVFLTGAYGNNTVSFGEIHDVLYDLYSHGKKLKMLKWANDYAVHEKISRKKFIKKLTSDYRDFDNREDLLERFVPGNPFISKEILQNYNLRERFNQNRRFIISRGFVSRENYKEYEYSESLLIYLGIFETKFGLRNNMILRDPTKDIRILRHCRKMVFSDFAKNGKTRSLIRENFQNLLPDSIITGYGRRAVINSDWLNRVERDQKTLIPELITIVKKGIIGRYIPATRIIEYLVNLNLKDKRQRRWFKEMCGIISLCEFYDRNR